MISTIVAIAVFLYEMSVTLSDLSVIQSLGELYFTLMSLSIVIRALDLQYLANISTKLSFTSGYTKLVTLQAYYLEITNSSENWQNCPAGDITWKNVIPNWRLVSGEPILYLSTLQDYIGENIRAVRFI